tara:strand:+ start:4099 stop:4644 length:546 start_codon:yes stop_codon:yes gene_type:complete
LILIKNKLIIIPIKQAKYQDKRIPDKPTNAKSKINFNILYIVFLMKTMFDFLFAISAMLSKLKIPHSKENAKRARMLDQELKRGASSGENKPIPAKNIAIKIMFNNEETTNPLNTTFPGFRSLGKYLRKDMFSPKYENNAIKPINETIVVAIPTSYEENFLAAIAQKRNPKKLIKPEFRIK